MAYTFDEEKMKQLILYFAADSINDMNFGKTKLNKLLFFADFKAYLNYFEPITKAKYIKLQNGPVPDNIDVFIQELIIDGYAEYKKINKYGRIQKQLIALKEYNLDLFKPYEIDIINKVLNQFKDMNNMGISDYSHEYAGWKYAMYGEEIPYYTALLDPDTTLTEEQYKYGGTLLNA